MDLPEKIGKYHIQRMLGKGGMSVVYKAHDPAILRSVAIKAITKSRLDNGELKHVTARFRHEAQAVGRLTHARIVQIYDYGEDDDSAFIVMELVNGKTLHQHLLQELNYEIHEVGKIIGEILEGIGHAHANGVIHRDIKPSNILINNDGRIKISDFGIARIESSNLTQIGDVLGTPHYMAPEQFLGGEVDALADLFSIGVIAYELATGRRPFSGNSAGVMQQVLNDNPPPASSINSSLSSAMDRVLQHALAKKREDRFQSAREFAVAFEEAVASTLALHGRQVATPPAPDSMALLSAARLLDTSYKLSTNTRDLTPGISVDSPISLDVGVRRGRMLIVDDEVRILTALKALFRSRYHVFTTTDAAKALDFLNRYPMHVIISDQRMPGMTGVELLRLSREASPNSVRILLTGYSDLAAIVGSINDGEVYRFISKPWDNNNLQIMIGEAATIALALADTKSVKVDLPQHMDAGVLVLDKDDEIVRVVRQLIGGLCPVVHAVDLDAALAAMQTQEIAVVLTDIVLGRHDLTNMLKLLKQENPQILSIIVTHASDSELVIELINQAQIFRFLNKPVNVQLLKGHLHAALQTYLRYQKTPALTRAHVVEVSESRASTAVTQRMMDSIRSLRLRWFGARG